MYLPTKACLNARFLLNFRKKTVGNSVLKLIGYDIMW